jgi:dsRNA-specific ribonuclease
MEKTITLGGSLYESHVLNEKNKYISKDILNKIFLDNDLKHKVKNLKNFQLAMIHKSYLKSVQMNEKMLKLVKEIPPIDKNVEAIPLQENSYETLEFLGDAVIHLVLAKYLYERYENKDPGFLTVLRTKIEKGETLNKLSRQIGLHEYAIFARNIELAGGRYNNVNIMEDIFEAFMGALSLETTFENCEIFLKNLIDKYIDFADMINTEDNFKEMLMQYYHKLGFKTTPTYNLLEIIEEKPKKKFVMAAYDPDKKLIGKGTSTSKISAAQIAAKNALIKFNLIKQNDESSDDEIYEII